MTCYVGLDVSMKETAICVIDEAGERLWAGKTRTDPDAIATALAQKAAGATKVGIETGPFTVWLWHALSARGLPMVCLHARHAAAALKLQMNKTDRNDATAWPSWSGRDGTGLLPCVRSRRISCGRC